MMVGSARNDSQSQKQQKMNGKHKQNSIDGRRAPATTRQNLPKLKIIQEQSKNMASTKMSSRDILISSSTRRENFDGGSSSILNQRSVDARTVQEQSGLQSKYRSLIELGDSRIQLNANVGNQLGKSFFSNSKSNLSTHHGSKKKLN